GVDVVILSDAYARRHFPDRDPVGETVLLGPNSRFTVVGVTAPVRIRDLTSDFGAGDDDPDLYIPFGRAPAREFAVAVRAGTSDPAALLPEVRRAVARLDPSLVVARAAPLSTGIRNQTAQARFGTFLLGAFSALALILAAVGIYGVTAVSVGRRSREIAIRMAMGADARGVRGMVVGQGMKLVVAGLALGVVGAAFLARTLSALLYGVGEVDPATYAAVAGLLGAVGLLATWIPARRATTVDPQRTLAAE
ncbi:MAG TPA: FtsX-like permease family protein, partial [Longimicrobiales bacterium]|nr:FtsX-like permease family protein [Longimicrobiales bacterium]